MKRREEAEAKDEIIRVLVFSASGEEQRNQVRRKFRSRKVVAYL